MTGKRLAVVLLAALCVASPSSLAGAACTATFTADAKGTFPDTLTIDAKTKVLTVDLSGLPRGATIFRAALLLKDLPPHTKAPLEPTTVYPDGHPEKRLRFLPPRYRSLDALDAVRAAAGAGEALRLKVEVTLAGVERLEVSYLEGKPKAAAAAKVTNLKAAHRGGQSLITFTEPRLKAFPDFKTGADVKAFRNALLKERPGLRFRIWRGPEKITPRTIAKARLVGECGPLTGWNATYHQDKTQKEPPVRYRVIDLGEPAPWGTGIWAHNPRRQGRAYYAVTVADSGEEDLDALGPANTTAEAVEETVGPGVPVLQWIERPETWQYRQGPLTRLIYTRWEAFPRSSTPSNPIDYLVAMGDAPKPERAVREAHQRAFRVEPAPVGLHLHCWGGSLNGGYGWWYNAHRGAVLIASNQIPYDWWTGYHARRGTAKTWGDDGVYPFSMTRTFAFLDWAATQWHEAPETVRKHWRKLDMTRVFAAGNSMGGAGAPMFAVRYGKRIAWCNAWVGVHVPAMSPQFRNSYEQSYGPPDAPVRMVHDRKTSPWDWFSDVWWLRKHLKQETGLVIASNGKNDGGIGWPQAHAFARALQETRRPHIYNWGIGGHGTRTLIGANVDFDVRTDQTLPAFTNGTLDDDIGTATRRPETQVEAERRRLRDQARKAGKNPDHVKVDPYDGDPVGACNAHLWWETETLVDEAGRWEMTVILKDSAPKDACRVDLTPRRLQTFRTPKGKRFAYTVTDLGRQEVLGKGAAAADADDLLTLEQIPLAKGKNRVRIVPVK